MVVAIRVSRSSEILSLRALRQTVILRRNDEGSPLRQRFFTPFRMTEGGQYF